MTYRTRGSRQWHGHGSWHGHGHWHEHGRWHEHGWFGRGRRGRRFGSREELISALERYQQRLEQRAADVAEKIRHLRAEGTSEAENPEGTDATPTSHHV